MSTAKTTLEVIRSYGKEPKMIVAQTLTSQISFGRFPHSKAMRMGRTLQKQARIIHEIERWFELLSVSELRLTRTVNRREGNCKRAN